MKNLFSALGMVLAASFSLVSCAEDRLTPVDNAAGEGVPFEISTVITKTSNNDLTTKWAKGDQINLFHAEAGTTISGTTNCVNDNAFTVDDGLSGKFTGTLTSALTDGTKYDWYALYPYSSYVTTPANADGYTYIGCRSDQSQIQAGNDSKAHLCGTACPLYGIATSVASDEKPALTMKNLASVVAIKVTNTLDEALTVSSVSFTSTESIVGQFAVDFSSDSPKTRYTDGTYVSSTANLTVSGGTAIAKGASAIFYIAIKPHTVKNGSDLVISVNGISKTLTLTKDIIFTAGSIKTIGYNYDYVKTIVETKDDEITISTTKIKTDDSAYQDWSGVKGSASDAVYAGQSARGESQTNLSIQLRCKSSAGIISTVSGGKVKKVVVTWNSSTKKDGTRILNVYGSNAAYTAVSDLYDSSKQGTLLGTIVCGTSTELEINSDYAYIGLRSSKEPMYLDKIVIAWDASGVTKDPIIVAGDVTGVSARGCSDETLEYSITNPVDGTAISATCDGTVVTKVTVTDGTVKYAVSGNTSGEAREGKISLTYGSVTKDVKVSQLADTFKTTATEIELGATADSQKTFIITSDFDWEAAITGADYKVSPASYKWAEGGKQTITVTATADNASESGTISLGKITFTNSKTGKTLSVTVTQKSSYVAPVTGTSVEFDYSTLYKSVTAKTKDLDGTLDTVDGVSIAYDKVSGNNTPKYYVNGTNLRIYNKSTLTITVPSGETITAVDFSQGTTSWVNGKMAGDHGTVSDTDKKWMYDSTKTSNSLVLTITGTFNFTKIVVTYE